MSKGRAGWDPHQLFLESAEEIEANRLKAIRRKELKAEWLKKTTNPFKAPGYQLMDPAVQRFYALRLFSYGQFKPQSARSIAWLIGFTGSFYALYRYVANYRYRVERKYRTGQVAYKDRFYKLL